MFDFVHFRLHRLWESLMYPLPILDCLCSHNSSASLRIPFRFKQKQMSNMKLPRRCYRDTIKTTIIIQLSLHHHLGAGLFRWLGWCHNNLAADLLWYTVFFFIIFRNICCLWSNFHFVEQHLYSSKLYLLFLRLYSSCKQKFSFLPKIFFAAFTSKVRCPGLSWSPTGMPKYVVLCWQISMNAVTDNFLIYFDKLTKKDLRRI